MARKTSSEDNVLGPQGPVYRGTNNTNVPAPKKVGMNIKRTITTSQKLVDFPTNKSKKVMKKDASKNKTNTLSFYET